MKSTRAPANFVYFSILSDSFLKIRPNQNKDPLTRFQYPLALISILVILATLHIERKATHVLIEREDPTIEYYKEF
ncbi:hypothetical protein H5410_038117 [Solanum commersonii]|uniref:Uncharacterized protein n=1 Tax=Solanum commersonii TaxID=4109 RepID=A0A9J5Y9U7_SOLCO|nr:hypothetical protein H5410_038117 [Solanum commersonii]